MKRIAMNVCYFKNTSNIVNSRKTQRVLYRENATVEFKNIHKTLKQPFDGYADFEYILKRVNDIEDVTTGIVESSNNEIE